MLKEAPLHNGHAPVYSPRTRPSPRPSARPPTSDYLFVFSARHFGFSLINEKLLRLAQAPARPPRSPHRPDPCALGLVGAYPPTSPQFAPAAAPCVAAGGEGGGEVGAAVTRGTVAALRKTVPLAGSRCTMRRKRLPPGEREGNGSGQAYGREGGRTWVTASPQGLHRRLDWSACKQMPPVSHTPPSPCEWCRRWCMWPNVTRATRRPPCGPPALAAAAAAAFPAPAEAVPGPLAAPLPAGPAARLSRAARRSGSPWSPSAALEGRCCGRETAAGGQG
jgi:hypothetical protein